MLCAGQRRLSNDVSRKSRIDDTEIFGRPVRVAWGNADPAMLRRRSIRATRDRASAKIIRWTCEAIATATLVGLPTGSREAELIAEIAQNHEHWIGTRDYANPEVRSAWEQDGTWVRRPILLDRSAIHPDLSGLQVVEGRTRFGILRGRHAAGIAVAPTHSVWVGRPVHSSGGK
ncbi:hypothetical protein ABIE52_000407 [Rhodococcus sp. OAS809]